MGAEGCRPGKLPESPLGRGLVRQGDLGSGLLGSQRECPSLKAKLPRVHSVTTLRSIPGPAISTGPGYRAERGWTARKGLPSQMTAPLAPAGQAPLDWSTRPPPGVLVPSTRQATTLVMLSMVTFPP